MKHTAGFIVGNKFQGLIPRQPQVPAMFFGELDRYLIGFTKVPMDFFVPSLALVVVAVRRSVCKPADEFEVNNSGLLMKFTSNRGHVIRIAVLHVAFGQVPMPLRVLKKQHRAAIDKHNTAGGLHASPCSVSLMVMTARGER